MSALLAPSARGAAPEFSADVVFIPVAAKADGGSTRPAAPTVSSAKLYVRAQQLRLEPRGVTGETLIVDDAKNTTVALFPAQKAYQSLGSRPSKYFRVADADRACAEWQQAVGTKIDCEKTGRDLVDGRSSVKYTRHLSGGSAEYVWIDRKLNFVIKWHNDRSEAQLRNIHEGPQAAELFEIPQDYKPQTPRKSRPSPVSR